MHTTSNVINRFTLTSFISPNTIVHTSARVVGWSMRTTKYYSGVMWLQVWRWNTASETSEFILIHNNKVTNFDFEMDTIKCKYYIDL